MKRIIFLSLLFLLLTGCATTQSVYDPRTGRYVRSVAVDTATPTAVGVNTGVGAVIGCGALALLGTAVGDPAGGCALGAVAGGYAGAMSTREETFVTSSPRQGYAPLQESPCTEEYNRALREIKSTTALRRQEAANYRITGDQNGLSRVENGINAWEANSTEAIRVRYQNCIAQLRIDTQEQQYVPQAPVYSSRPVFPEWRSYYYPYPQYYDYGYYPYRGQYGGWWGHNRHHHRPHNDCGYYGPC